MKKLFFLFSLNIISFYINIYTCEKLINEMDINQMITDNYLLVPFCKKYFAVPFLKNGMLVTKLKKGFKVNIKEVCLNPSLNPPSIDCIINPSEDSDNLLPVDIPAFDQRFKETIGDNLSFVIIYLFKTEDRPMTIKLPVDGKIVSILPNNK
jgi:hypothetical protein